MNIFWNNKRVLITGGAGYLACALAALLKDRAATLIRFDRPGAIFPSLGGAASVRDVEGDIRDPHVWDNLLPECDVIFHLAAQTSAAKADADPEADRAVNTLPVLHLVAACRRLRAAPAVVFSGTATECGLADRLPVSEEAEDRPITAYDRHKLEAERALKQADRDGVLRAVTLRLPNLYGPGPAGSSADRGILNLMIRRALAGAPLTVFGSGDYLRDYLFVEDAARAFVLAAERMDTLHGGHYLLGTGTGHTVRQAFERVAERVAAAGGPRVAVETNPAAPIAPIETRRFVADPSRFSACTGWRAEVELAEGIDRTLRFFQSDAP